MSSSKSVNKLTPHGYSVDDPPVKINKWDGSALKNTLDDAAKKVMIDGLGFKESNRLMDGRLIICSIAVAFALFALLWDYLRPFPASRPVLILCVLSYFVLMGVLTVYITYKEKSIFLVALEKDKAGIDPDNQWTLSSYIKRYDEVYNITIAYKDGITKATREASFSRSAGNFFDENGLLCFDLYEPAVKKLQHSLASDKKKK